MKISLITRDIMILLLLIELIIAGTGTRVINEVCFGIWGILLLIDTFIKKAGD